MPSKKRSPLTKSVDPLKCGSMTSKVSAPTKKKMPFLATPKKHMNWQRRIGTLSPKGSLTEPVETEIAPSSAVSLIDLEEGLCRWPFGNPKDFDTFRYCGAPVVSNKCNYPYCKAHSKLSYTTEYGRPSSKND